jgi:hypothetical protein
LQCLKNNEKSSLQAFQLFYNVFGKTACTNAEYFRFGTFACYSFEDSDKTPRCLGILHAASSLYTSHLFIAYFVEVFERLAHDSEMIKFSTMSALACGCFYKITTGAERQVSKFVD